MKKYYIVILSLILCILSYLYCRKDNLFFGGIRKENSQECLAGINNDEERFFRPSKEIPLILDEENIINQFYNILKEASNMNNISGGCGLIGEGNVPYAKAYELLSNSYRKKVSLKKFIASFKSIAHISLLKVYELPTKNNHKYFFVEIEVIDGKNKLSYFGYFYAGIRVINEGNKWLIDNIEYYKEDFLCAFYHGWDYDALSIVNLVYKENLEIIDKVSDYQESTYLIYVFAEKDDKKYRFDFIRITNGYDILIRENIMINGIYTPSELLTKKWAYLKFTVK